MASRRDFSSGFDVNLIAKERKRNSERPSKFFLQFPDFRDSSTTEFGGHASQPFIDVVTRESYRNDGRAHNPWIICRKIAESLFENGAIVDIRTQNDLSVQLNVRIEQAFKLVRNIRPRFVHSEKICPGFQIRRVHRNILWRQALLDYPLHLVLGD